MGNKKGLKNHQWGEWFKHGGTYWQRCELCGLWKIYIGCRANYSPNGQLANTDTKRIDCDRSLEIVI